MTNVVDDMMAAVEKRGPKVPIPTRKVGHNPVHEAPGAAKGVEESAAEATSPPVQFPARRVTQRSNAELSGRLMRVQLTAEQERWLMNVVGDAFKDGRRVSETSIVRLAVEELRQHGGWSELQRHFK